MIGVVEFARRVANWQTWGPGRLRYEEVRLGLAPAPMDPLGLEDPVETAAETAPHGPGRAAMPAESGAEA